MGFSLNPFQGPRGHQALTGGLPFYDPLDLWGEQAKSEADRQNRMIEDAKAEEARKDALRASINRLYGIGPETEQYQSGTSPLIDELDSEGNSQRSGGSPLYGTRSTGVPEARAGFATEETDLSKALRGYYGDEQRKGYRAEERNMRFGLANQGQTGGSVMADSLADLEERNRLGGTRIEEAVQRALNSLRASRESSRLGALSLVNAGQGEEGVRSASAGLKSSLDTAKATNREDLFTDLFSNVAAGKEASDARSREARLLAAFQQGRSGIQTNSGRSGATIVPYDQ